MRYAPPSYLGDGTLEWDGLGYHLAGKPDVNLLAPAALADSNPWVVFTGALERAKDGDFGALSILFESIRSSDDDVLWRYCAELLGDAGPASLLRIYIQRFRRELFDAQRPLYQIELCHAFSQSMLLWTIPTMLEIYLRSTHRVETGILTVLISRLLEKDLGPIACASASDEEYGRFVTQKYDELRAALGTEDVPVLYGARFSVKALAKCLHADLTAPEINETRVMEQRHLFEAATGIDCSGFYETEELRPIKATAIVEEFIESPEVEKYQDGVRYFFGHRIPD